MQPVRLGVIGCGVIGTVHLQYAAGSPLIEITAVADLIEANRRKAADQFKPKRIYENGGDLLEDAEVEAVVLAFPTCARTELALRAFEKGKHVLMEKPAAMNSSEVQAMIVARGDRVAACCCSRFRFYEAADVAAEFIATGALGDIRVVRCRAISTAGKKPEKPPPGWRLKKAVNGGGFLVNWGCYDMDYLLGITGWKLKPRLAFAQTWTVPPQFASHIAPESDAETYYVALVRCENGTMISMERGEYMPTRTEEVWQIVGTKGSLRLNMQTPTREAVIHDNTTDEGGVISKTLWESAKPSFRRHADPTTDFAAAIRENRPPKTSLEQALIIQKITDAIYASAERGVAVEV